MHVGASFSISSCKLFSCEACGGYFTDLRATTVPNFGVAPARTRYAHALHSHGDCNGSKHDNNVTPT